MINVVLLDDFQVWCRGSGGQGGQGFVGDGEGGFLGGEDCFAGMEGAEQGDCFCQGI